MHMLFKFLSLKFYKRTLVAVPLAFDFILK